MMPTRKFNSHTARLLEPKEKSIEYFVEGFNVGYPGSLGLRVSPKGKKIWFVMYRWNGSRIKYNLTGYPAMKQTQATTEATEILKQVAKGINPKQKKRDYLDSPTFNDLIPVYLKNHASRKKDGGHADMLKLNHSRLDCIRDMKAGDIRRKHIVAILSGMGVQGNRYLSLLRKFFSVCIRRDLLPENFSNPASEVDKPAKEIPCERVYSEAEIHTLFESFESLPLLLSTALKIVLLTGQRPTEIYGLRWSEVDLDAGLITLPGERTKNGKEHQVPLVKQVADMLPEPTNSEFVFPARTKCGHVLMSQIYMIRVRKESGIEDFKPHSLRRTMATGLGDLQVEDSIISRCLNHTLSGVTNQVYNRSKYLEPKRIALQKWADEVDRINSKE